jgi:integrase
MKLTNAAVRALKPRERPYKVFDGKGLYLLKNPDGSALWRLKYRYGGKERLLAYGAYPEVSIKEARARGDKARTQLRDGIDPSAARKAEKAARGDRESRSFERIAREWHAKKCERMKDAGGRRILRRLEIYVFPRIGDQVTGDLTAPDLLHLLRRIEDKGHPETAHRVKQYLSAIFRYAVATNRATHDPTVALKHALLRPPAKNHASITEPKQVGALLRAIRGYSGSDMVRCALQLMPLVFVRPGELRGARWQEFEFNLTDPKPGETQGHAEPLWRIPASRMKMGQQHIVPLSIQAVEVLRELHSISGPDGYVFPSVRSKARPMSDNTINAALRGMGYAKDQLVGHGFRHMASTLLHERGHRSEYIERQLSHGDRNTIRAIYNFADYLPERRKMMQEWADYLGELAKGADVVSINSAKIA